MMDDFGINDIKHIFFNMEVMDGQWGLLFFGPLPRTRTHAHARRRTHGNTQQHNKHNNTIMQ